MAFVAGLGLVDDEAADDDDVCSGHEPTTTTTTDTTTVPTLVFPFVDADYRMSTAPGAELGRGLWSTVYPARPAALTPPATPTMRRDSAVDRGRAKAYAVKTPASLAARAVLAQEARVLSHLFARPLAALHVVPFHGLDPRNGALVLDALPLTLAGYIASLNRQPEPDRAAGLALAFPALALECASGLRFIHQAQVVHADVKPDNVLLCPTAHRSPRGDTVYRPLFADFSSSFILCTPGTPSDGAAASASTASATATGPSSYSRPLASLGGGSWDFLAPCLVDTRRWPSCEPSPETDVHALAITLLCLIVGHSPFDAAGDNAFLRREMVKQGRAMDCVLQDIDGERRLRSLESALHWVRGNVQEWLDDGLWERSSRRSNHSTAASGSSSSSSSSIRSAGGGTTAATWVRLVKERM